MKVVISSITALEKNIQSELKAKFKIKKLNAEQIEVASDIAILIAQNEHLSDWAKNYKSYIDDPSRCNLEISDKIDELAISHNLDNRSASILFHSIK